MLITRWREIYSRLNHLQKLQILRCVLGPNSQHAEIHGFVDASNHAYAAVIYIKVVSLSGQVTRTLLVGKSKVAPLKPLSTTVGIIGSVTTRSAG